MNFPISRTIATLILLLYPISVITIKQLNGPLFSITVLLGFWHTIAKKEQTPKIIRQEKLIYLSICLFFLCALATTYLSGYNREGKKIIEILSHLLLLIPITIGLRHVGINLFALWVGLAIGSIVSGIFVCYLFLWKEIPRAGDNIINAIVVGNLSLIMGFMSLAGASWFKEKNIWLTLIPIIACGFGVLASFFSLSRGGWLAIPFMLFIYFRYSSLQYSKKAIVAMLSVVALATTFIYCTPQTNVEHRLKRTISDITTYLSIDKSNPDYKLPETAIRLEIWKSSWRMYTDHPIMGIGFGHYKENAQAQVDAGQSHPLTASFRSMHNQFLSALVNGGPLTLGTLLSFFVFLILFFRTTLLQSTNSATQGVALAGLVLIVGFIIFNLTCSHLERSRTLNFFTFYLAIFMATIATQNQKYINKNKNLNSRDKHTE